MTAATGGGQQSAARLPAAVVDAEAVQALAQQRYLDCRIAAEANQVPANPQVSADDVLSWAHEELVADITACETAAYHEAARRDGDRPGTDRRDTARAADPVAVAAAAVAALDTDADDADGDAGWGAVRPSAEVGDGAALDAAADGVLIGAVR